MKLLSLLALFTVALAAADVATLKDWPSYGGTYAALRYSTLDQINTSNVKGLGPAWIFQTGDYENGLQATPIVIDGVIYISTSNTWVFALDGASGPHTPADIPHTRKAPDDDYLGIGTYGGGSDHFTEFGAGVYSFNWWFNARGRLHPDRNLWPDTPPDTFMSIGAGGNCAVMIPSRDFVLAAARANWGRLAVGDESADMNRHIKLLVSAAVGAGE